MPRRKLTRFKAIRPDDEALQAYGQLYTKGFVYSNPEKVTPITSQAVFKNSKPLILDLGCGRGEFSISQAKEAPNYNVVGIDNHLKSIYASINRAGKTGLKNIKFIQLDIMNALKRVESDSISQIFLLFPPPVLKEKFQYKDVITGPFMTEVGRCLEENGRFHFVTDIESYFRNKVSLINQSHQLKLIEKRQSVEGGLTRFQVLWESYGELSFRVMYKKTRR